MPPKKNGRKAPLRAKSGRQQSATATGTTVSGPSHPTAAASAQAQHAAEQEALAAAMPFNTAKPSEYASRQRLQASRGLS